MPHRFPQLAPPESPRAVAKALPTPSLRWLDAIIFGMVVLILRQFWPTAFWPTRRRLADATQAGTFGENRKVQPFVTSIP